MARIRTIKPTFFTSLTIADLTVEQRLTFIGLWTHVDDDGRCVYDPRLIKAAIWPLDDRSVAEVEDDVRALTESSLITHYVVSDRSYLTVNGWAEHQRINRPVASKLPALSEGEIRPLTCSDEDSRRTHVQLTEDSLRERKGREGKGRTTSSDLSDEIEDRFDEFWQQYPRRDGKQDARKAWAQVTKKVDAQTILDGLAAYAFRPDPQFIPMPASWLRGQRWEDEGASVHQLRNDPHAGMTRQIQTSTGRWREVGIDELDSLGGVHIEWRPAL